MQIAFLQKYGAGDVNMLNGGSWSASRKPLRKAMMRRMWIPGKRIEYLVGMYVFTYNGGSLSITSVLSNIPAANAVV